MSEGHKEGAPDRFDMSTNNKTLVFGGIFTIVALSITFIMSKVTKTPLELKDYVSIFSAGAVCTTLFYNAKNLQLNFKYNKERIDFDREKYENEGKNKDSELSRRKTELTFQICSEWYKGEMSTKVERSRRFLNEHKDIISKKTDKFCKALEESEDDRRSVISILNYFETISCLIRKDVIDEEIVKSMFKTLFVDYYTTLKAYIDHHQKGTKRYLAEYETIAEKWAKS